MLGFLHILGFDNKYNLAIIDILHVSISYLNHKCMQV